jgi:hypothetical protein
VNGKDGAIYAKTEQLDSLAEKLEKIPKRRAAEALNSILKTAERNVWYSLPRVVPRQFAISESQVKKSMHRRKVQSSIHQEDQSIVIEVFGRRLQLTDFEHSPMLPPGRGRGNRYNVNVKVYNDRGNMLIRPIYGSDGRKKSVFLAPSSTKTAGSPFLLFRRTGEYHQSLFHRAASFKAKGRKVKFKTGKGVEKVEALQGMAIPQMVTTAVVATPLLESLNKSIDRKIQKELKNIID